MSKHYRSVIDDKGREYVFHVDKNVLRVATLTAQRGKLVAFRTSKRASWKMLDGSSSIGVRSINLQEPIKLNVDPETWVSLIENQLSSYSDKGFSNRPKLKISVVPGLAYSPDEILEDQEGNLYVEETKRCAVAHCDHEIVGRQYLRYKKTGDGKLAISIERFRPNDPEAVRVKTRSRSWFCRYCAGKKIELPGVDKEETVEKKVQPGYSQKTPGLESAIKNIEALLEPDSAVDSTYSKGANWALTLLRPYLKEQ